MPLGRARLSKPSMEFADYFVGFILEMLKTLLFLDNPFSVIFYIGLALGVVKLFRDVVF